MASELFCFAVVGEDAVAINLEQTFVVSIADQITNRFTGELGIIAGGGIVEIKNMSMTLLGGSGSERIDSVGSISGLPRIGNDLQFQRR